MCIRIVWEQDNTTNVRQRSILCGLIIPSFFCSNHSFCQVHTAFSFHCDYIMHFFSCRYICPSHCINTSSAAGVEGLEVFITIKQQCVTATMFYECCLEVYYTEQQKKHVCSDPVQSHYDEKFIHDNRLTSQNEIRAKCSLDICLKFSTHASGKQNSQRQNMVNFYSIKHHKFNLRFFCCSVYNYAFSASRWT